jgi:hypothetical protein
VSRRITQVRRYVEEAQGVLGLLDLTIKVTDEQAPEDTYADIQVHPEAPEATIRIAHGFWTLTPDEQRRVIVHELLHCHMAAMVNLKDDLEKTLGTAAFDIFDAAFERAHERTTDKLARLMAPLLPLPPKFGRS